MQHVRDQTRRSLRVERRALAHAEAMLLVDDDDREPVEHDVGLEQRMRADDERQLPRGELRERVGAPLGGGGTGQQRGAHGLAGHQRLQRREVLLGEHLGRRHEDRLHVVLDGAQDRVQRDDGLARADLPHEQPLHRARLRELVVEDRDRPALVARQLERQQLLAPAHREVALPVERGRGARGAALRAAAQQRQLGEQQLVEGEAAAAALEVAGVRGDERGGAVGHPAGAAHPRRKRVDGVVRDVQVRAHEREDLRRGQPGGRRVVRDLGVRAGVLRVGACPSTLKSPRGPSLPCSTRRVPFGYLLASHGWLKNVALTIPVASATCASTSGFIPRRRTGRLAIERTSTTIVAPSPGVSVATVRASRRSRGRCSSRSPTVSSPSDAAASAAFAGLTLSGACSADGRGQRTGAPSSSSRSSCMAVAKAVGTRPS